MHTNNKSFSTTDVEHVRMISLKTPVSSIILYMALLAMLAVRGLNILVRKSKKII